jgi:alcohol dehydrogenase class IV
METRTAVFPTRPFVGPARVLYGPGASGSIGAELLSLGARPAYGIVVVVADAALVELGLVGPIHEAIAAAGFEVRAAPAVAREPTPETVTAALDSAGSDVIAAVVGVGGGSAIDASKLVAASATNDIPLTVGLPATAELRSGPVLAAIPTTAGTGAEATSVAMLWHEGRKRIFVNQALVPHHATLDPALLSELPASIVAATGLDAISHAIESLISNFRTPMTEAASRSALTRLAQSLQLAYAGSNQAARGNTLLGAHEAGLALNASVVSGHSIAYAIASRTGLSHGVTCAMALPYCLAYSVGAAEAVIAEIGTLVASDPTAAGALAWAVELTGSMQMPSSLSEVGIAADALGAMAQEIVDLYPRPNSPAPLEFAPLKRLLEHFHSGDINAAWNDAAVRPAI